MKKDGFLPLLLLASFMFPLSFASAAISLGDALSSVDPSTMVLGIVFIVSFAILRLALSNAFRGNETIAGVIAFALSLGIVYSINYYGFDFQGFFSGLGIQNDTFYTFVPLLLLIGIIYLGVSYGFGIVLAIAGAILIVISFTDLVVEGGWTFSLGALLAIIGLWLWHRKRNPYSGGSGMLGRGAGKVADKFRDVRDARRQEQQDQEQRTQAREGIRRRVHDLINEMRRIDNEFKSVTSAIGRANKSGNQQQAAVLEQQRNNLRQQRRDIESEIRRLRREHSGNL